MTEINGQTTYQMDHQNSHQMVVATPKMEMNAE